MTEDSGYMLKPLREEAGLMLYRGKNIGTLAPVIALAAAHRSTSQGVRRLEYEWSLASELDPAWAAVPLELTRYAGRPTLVLQDPGGEPLDRIIAAHSDEPLDLAQCLRIAAGLAAALGEAHRHGLIHRDIKPANVLVDRSGRAWLMGFGIASRLPRERLAPVSAEIVAGTLPYMSPEQTGRMNRSVDARSDLYSLGVTLYELLTTDLPFTASDPMEWVHCHIARQPLPPQERKPHVPSVVSSIVMKLLAKTPEARYQTAAAVERDIRRCLTQWLAEGRVDDFPLGERDMPDQLLVPEKLYGREDVVESLIACFDRVAAGGHPELVLVSGYSGVGKSAVVNELHKPLVPSRGLFASGKFDRYKTDIPFATLAQALGGLVRLILTRSAAEISHWRQAIGEELGADGQLVVDLVPDLKLIIGERSPVPPLPPRDAQLRFRRVIRRLVNVFTRDHPLALFLDDLQWIDAATLDLIEDLLTQPDVKHLLLIGAYRDNEVSPTHPLKGKVAAIQQSGSAVHEIVLRPLSRPDLELLLADTLRRDRQCVAPLARLLEEKTNGNPFFAIQFIYALADEGLLFLDHRRPQWSWDLERIRAKGYTDNVADLMVDKLNHLAPETRVALQQLACIGNRVDFATLRLVHGDSVNEMHRQLWPAVQSGLILRSDESYRFLHDRVQEAAYSTIPESQRSKAHFRIGMLMADHTSPAAIEERIFEIVNQLNRGASLAASIAEHERIAHLNLIAGRRAKSSTAYISAIGYLRRGRAMLTDETWNGNEDLIFSIESLLAECELLTGGLDAAESRLAMLRPRARDPRHAALITRLQLTLYNLMDRSYSGVEAFIEYQKGRGEHWSAEPDREEAAKEFHRVWAMIANRRMEALIDAPLLTDSTLLDILEVYTEAVSIAQFTDENLHALILCRIVDLSLRHGNSDASCFAYVTLGVLAGSQFGNYDAGYQLGKLAYELVERHGLTRFRARVYMRFGNLIIPWKRHVRAGRELVRRAFDEANRSGDLTFAAYSCTNLYINMLMAADPLSEVQLEAEAGLEFAARLRFGRVISMIETQIMFVRTLRGLTDRFGSFDDGDFDEAAFERHLSDNPTLARPECWYWIRKLQALFYAGDFACAIKASENAARLFARSQSYFDQVEYHFFRALALSSGMDSTSEDVQSPEFKAVYEHHAKLARWAEGCPDNFENCSALVEAEIARVEGRVTEAEHLYEKAIRSAQANGFLHNEATANELAGRFYAARGFEKTARAYLRDARSCFLSWGADGKVRQLDRLYPQILDEAASPGATATIVSPAALLDLATVFKLSQALSSEIFLPRLIETLVRLVVQNAGANRGLLILVHGGVQESEPRIEAEATDGPGGIHVTVGQATIGHSDLLRPALDYVLRTRQRVLLNDALADTVYSVDEYVQKSGARSVLCLPVIKQTELRGVLYLENNLLPGVFTSDRLALLQVLASQAAISLENATLYTNLQRSEAFLAQGEEISHTGTFGWNASNGDHYWSEEGYRITEFDRRVKPSLDLMLERVHPEDRESVRVALEAAISEKTEFDSQHRFLMPDGRIKYVHALGRTVNVGNLDFVGAIRDVSERKRAEEDLRQAMTDLARLNRATTMGEVAASLAHELNQPITGAISYASACLRWLSRETPDLEEARAAATNMVQDGHRAADIIHRIRKQFEKGALNRDVLEVGEILRDTVGLLVSEIDRYGIVVELDLAPDLPSVIGDRVQLQQVAMNLIVNGIEAIKDIDSAREIVVRSWRSLDEIVVSVRDTGAGVPPELADQIFDPFFTTKPHGTGMGLRISRSIVESHGGRLWLSEAAGRRSTFQFTLPTGEK